MSKEGQMPEIKPKDGPKTVLIYPVPGAFINGEPAVVREVTPEKATELLRYKPPAYTRTKPQE